MSDVYSSKWRRLGCCGFSPSFPWSLLSYPQPIWTLKFWKQMSKRRVSCRGRFWMRRGICTQQLPLCLGVLPGKVNPLYLASSCTWGQDVATCLCSPSFSQGNHNLDIHASPNSLKLLHGASKPSQDISEFLDGDSSILKTLSSNKNLE